MTTVRTAVEVATVWTSPEAPRPVDAPAVADVPDVSQWTAALDDEARAGLHGRTLTQLLRGEPAEVVEDGPQGWVRVVAPWQPCPEDARGYPGWVRRAHLIDAAGDAEPALPARIPTDRLAVMAQAGQFLGVRYLWGGTSPAGLDCSGLVHYAHRQAGVVVPRDAAAQQAAAAPVQLGDEQPGDLYFFARSDGYVFHVGFVSGPGTMLHAPETGGRIEEAPLSAERVATLVAAGRLIG